MKRARQRSLFLIDARTIVGVVGLFLSIVLHELFHILMHLGHITSMGIFTDSHTLAEVNVVVPQGYNAEVEEFAAYTITLVIILITVAAIGMIHDKKDTRTFDQIIFPKGNPLT